MKIFKSALLLSFISLAVTSCATYGPNERETNVPQKTYRPSPPVNYMNRLPSHSPTGGKLVLIDPNVHAWGAYDSSGDLIKAGLASAGSGWCADLGRPCHTKAGTFHVYSLGSPGCKSSIFPIPRGGAPMPYCMFFHSNQAMHGSPEGEVVEGNISHGCVRMHVWDAEWLRYHFVTVGTEVIVRPY